MSDSQIDHVCDFRPDERGERVCSECGVVDPTPQFDSPSRLAEPLAPTIGFTSGRGIRDGQGRPVSGSKLRDAIHLRKVSQKVHDRRRFRIRPEILQLVRLKSNLAGLPVHASQRVEAALKALAKARSGSGRVLYDETVSAAVYLVKQERREPWSFNEMKAKMGGNEKRLRTEIRDFRRLAGLSPPMAGPESYLTRFVGNVPPTVLDRARRYLAKLSPEAPIRSRPGHLLAGGVVYWIAVQETGKDGVGARLRAERGLTSARVAELAGASDSAILITANLLQRGEGVPR